MKYESQLHMINISILHWCYLKTILSEMQTPFKWNANTSTSNHQNLTDLNVTFTK